MDKRSVVERFARYRNHLGKAGLVTRATALALLVPYGVTTSDTSVVLAGLTLYNLGMEARNLHERLRPDNMMETVMHNMGDLFNDE